jgi:hypothetical protein
MRWWRRPKPEPTPAPKPAGPSPWPIADDIEAMLHAGRNWDAILVHVRHRELLLRASVQAPAPRETLTPEKPRVSRRPANSVSRPVANRKAKKPRRRAAYMKGYMRRRRARLRVIDGGGQ